MLEKVNAFFEAHLKDHHVIGVHMRGTDLLYAPPVHADEYVRNLESLVRKTPEARIFVATEQQQYLELIRSHFGDRVIWQDCLRSEDSTNPHKLESRSPALQGEEVLRDALLLSRCNLMLRGASAVPEVAHSFNPFLRSVDLNRAPGYPR